MPKNSGLKLFTKTWQPKREVSKDEENHARPLTATLDKPAILDISFISIIDMSQIRKEFLDISNLCRFPIAALAINKRKKTATVAVSNRPLSLPSPEKQKNARNKRPETREDSYFDDDEESCSIQSAKTVTLSSTRKVKKIEEINSLSLNRKSDANNNISSSSNNNNKTFKIPRKRGSNIAKLVEVKSDLAVTSGNNNNSKNSSTKLPEPCKTCGRPDQPERFHSHPVTPLKSVRKVEEPPKMKSTVQKPVAIKYKSKNIMEKKLLPPTTARKSSLPSQKLVHTPPNISGQQQQQPPSARQGSASKRTLTCYICGREFGTASLSLHEPKCLLKWERENANLPLNLQRKAPIKPDHPLTQEEWNKFAWESSQSTLTPCSNCGRTFYPDRLIVHQRSCRIALLKDSPVGKHQQPQPSPAAMPPPPSVECYICKKMFGTHSIKIHEKTCLKKWHTENDSLPPDARAAEPKKGQAKKLSIGSTPPDSSRETVAAAEVDTSSTSRKSPMFPCYICGRLFTVNSIYIHEPQCLKMWKIENDKLPASKRRPQPLKPDVKFTQDGKVDIEATNEAKWQSHLSQLVACQFCSRTFNPHRVEVHERSCKGNA